MVLTQKIVGRAMVPKGRNNDKACFFGCKKLAFYNQSMPKVKPCPKSVLNQLTSEGPLGTALHWATELRISRYAVGV